MTTKQFFKGIAVAVTLLACFTAGTEPSALTYICFGIIALYLIADYLNLSNHEHAAD